MRDGAGQSVSPGLCHINMVATGHQPNESRSKRPGRIRTGHLRHVCHRATFPVPVFALPPEAGRHRTTSDEHPCRGLLRAWKCQRVIALPRPGGRDKSTWLRGAPLATDGVCRQRNVVIDGRVAHCSLPHALELPVVGACTDNGPAPDMRRGCPVHRDATASAVAGVPMPPADPGGGSGRRTARTPGMKPGDAAKRLAGLRLAGAKRNTR